MKIITKKKYEILFVLFIISFLSSLILSVVPTPTICNKGEGCDLVQHSKYAYFFGVKNSYYGTLIFAFLSVLSFLQIKNSLRSRRVVIHLSVFIGFLIVVYFLYVQKFLLNTYCKYCLVVDFSMIIAFGVLLLSWKK